VLDVPTPYQCEQLRTGRIDLGIAHAFPGLVDHPSIAAVRLVADHLVCALVAASHPLAARPWLTGPDLADLPFLFMPRSFHPPFHDAVMEAFDGIGLLPRVESTFDGLRTVWTLAAEGVGWALGAHSEQEHPPAGVASIPIQGLEIPWGLELLWRKDEADDAHLSVLDLLRNQGTPTGTA